MKFKVSWAVFLLGNILLTMADVITDLLGNEIMESDTKFPSPLAQGKARKAHRNDEARIPHNRSRRETKIQRENFRLRLSLLYEISGKKNKWTLNRKTIKDAVKIVHSIFSGLHVQIVLTGLKEFKHQDLFPGTKSTNVLQRFINRGNENDNTQLITDRTLESGSDAVGAATFQTICLPGISRGIIIERQKNAHHLALVMAHNLACGMGILKKQLCLGVLREEDMRCGKEGKKGLTNNDIRQCIWKKLDPSNLNRFNLNALCEENKSKRNVPKLSQLVADQEDKNNSSKLVLILAPLGAALLLILAALSAYKWKQNRDKTRLLKNRVSVEQHYEKISPRPWRPSIINDPTVTFDLESK